ncbi:MAG: hypothetical protein HYY90_03220 [Candidatus Omnitrophica bacterium]|nr:hypothetical protein [Candidatus Omnitrophota bacterium]MBI3083355.1 hypothetical protein [Candidatus Omnitrophota bacterium]
MHLETEKVSGRIYLKKEDGTYTKLFWIEEHKPFDLFVGVYGTSGKAAKLVCEYNDQEVGGNDNTFTRRFSYADARLVNKGFDHFSFHPDGTFWIKLRNEEERYVHKLKREQPITGTTVVFQDFYILSDLVSRYTPCTGTLKKNSLEIFARSNSVIRLRIRISGIEYDIEKEVKQNDSITGELPETYVRWNGNTLKAVLKCEGVPIRDVSIFQKRPEGTIACFLFPITQNRCLTKGFHIN